MALASSKKFLDIQATVECRFTLKRVHDMIRTYSQMHRTHKYPQHSSIIWLNCWVFVYELSVCGVESRCNAFAFSFSVFNSIQANVTCLYSTINVKIPLVLWYFRGIKKKIAWTGLTWNLQVQLLELLIQCRNSWYCSKSFQANLLNNPDLYIPSENIRRLGKYNLMVAKDYSYNCPNYLHLH